MDAKPKRCQDKITYDSQRDAEAAIAVNKWRYEGTKQKVYRCRECGLWHVATDRA